MKPIRLLKYPEKVTSLFSWIDLLLLLSFVALIYGVQILASAWRAGLQPVAEISLSWKALPYYSFLSLSRSFAAYLLSLAFTFVYGYLAAYRPKAERVMVPVLDILQSIPVLGFLPGLVMGLVALFPRTNMGLELACILMIFTGQVWNMTFSFYYSLKSIPRELNEAAKIYHLGWWRRFTELEFPFSAIGLIWNSMMSMAGGWFFLTVTEAFVLGNKDFRLPGIGSYMSVAIQRGDKKAMWAAVIAMTIIIITVDKFLWKPLVAWSQKFKLEESESEEPVTSSVLNMLRRSKFFARCAERIRRFFMSDLAERFRTARGAPKETPSGHRKTKNVLGFLLIVGIVAGSAYGALQFFRLLSHLSLKDLRLILFSGLLTFLRVMASIILGTLWTVPLGVMIGSNPRLSKILQPTIQVFASFPAPMVFPLIMFLIHSLGGSIQYGSVLLMMVGTQWYILFNVIAGAMSIPHDLREAATLYRLTTRQRWSHLILPAIFPYLVTGWITAAGGAWNASIVSEYVHVGSSIESATGLGATISLATDRGDFPLLAGSIFLMAAMVVGINRFFWRKLYFFAQNRFSLNK
ncbi:MAG: ABC transporter permease subunit [bacterium]